MKSSGDVTFFLEEKAYDENGDLKVPKELAVNKMGHGILAV